MSFRLIHVPALLVVSLAFGSIALGETLPPLAGRPAPTTLDAAWNGFNPRAEPLDVEVLHQWEQVGVTLKVVRFRIGVFKGQKSMLAAVFGYPTAAAENGERIPGLLQIHGGGQYADANACITNAHRGYATVSIAWAGRISSSEYRVNPAEVKLFWDKATDDPNYRVTTDWGAVDAYHAPGRSSSTIYPSAAPTPWTIDSVESPRNSPWFLSAIAARRALTFLEQQPVVDPQRIGVYGHSMGGKLTVMASIDSRVRAAAPSCGGISDRTNRSVPFQQAICDQHSLKKIRCPIFFLSPSNDFHGRISDLPSAVKEIKTKQWRVNSSPHHNHQDTGEYEVATQLWFDQHLKGTFEFPETPTTELSLSDASSGPVFRVSPDHAERVVEVDVYYTQHGQKNGEENDHLNTIARFWHHAPAVRNGVEWTAAIEQVDPSKPLWVYADVAYPLDQPVTGAGYYYRTYTTDQYRLSSLIEVRTPEQIQSAGLTRTTKSSTIIEDFTDDWRKEWFTYRPEEWPLRTHKVYDETWFAPSDEARLSIKLQSDEPNTLVVGIDDFAATATLTGGAKPQTVVFSKGDFVSASDKPLTSWAGIRELRLGYADRLRAGEAQKVVGGRWAGDSPAFQQVMWVE